MEQFAVVAIAAIAFALILLAGRWIFGRLTETLSAHLRSGWRWLALPITAVVCGGAFAALRPLVVDQPRTPLWFVLGAASVALLFASATAFGWTLVEGGRRFVAAAWAEPPDPDDGDP